MPDPVTGIVGGSAVLGAIGGSKSSGGGTSTATSEPWKEQQPFLQYGFEQSKQAAENALASPVFGGQRVAGLTPEQQALIQQGTQFGTNQFGQAQGLQNMSMGALGATSGFGQNAADIYGQYAGVDPTQQIIAQAGQYANNPYTQGIIDSASRDVTRNLYENQLPSLALGATGTGNINSTRAGVQQGIAERGAAERLADISSNIRGQFFQSGLGQAQSQYNQNLQNQLAANQGVQGAFGAGVGGMGAGQQLGAGGFNLGQTAAGMNQSQQQAQLNAQMQQFAEERDIPMDVMARYMQTIGGNYGGTQTQTTPKTGGGFMGALQGAAGGALGGFGLATGPLGMSMPGVAPGGAGWSTSSLGTMVPASYGPVGPLGSFGGLY
jgi:hypothetical protein